MNRHDDHGSVTLELVILTPVFLLLIFVAITGVRIELAGASVEQASYDAARTASISRDAADAQSRALDAAKSTLAKQHLQCRGEPTVHVDTSGFKIPPGQPATITATVTCIVNLSDVAIPGLPGTKPITFSFVSDLDTYRARTIGSASGG
jgi:Flp pilus assembly protein TadG